jgi:hypothetical protein
MFSEVNQGMGLQAVDHKSKTLNAALDYRFFEDTPPWPKPADSQTTWFNNIWKGSASARGYGWRVTPRWKVELVVWYGGIDSTNEVIGVQPGWGRTVTGNDNTDCYFTNNGNPTAFNWRKANGAASGDNRYMFYPDSYQINTPIKFSGWDGSTLGANLNQFQLWPNISGGSVVAEWSTAAQCNAYGKLELRLTRDNTTFPTTTGFYGGPSSLPAIIYLDVGEQR